MQAHFDCLKMTFKFYSDKNTSPEKNKLHFSLRHLVFSFL